MKRLNLILAVLGLLLFPHFAQAQSQRNPCYYTTTGVTSCQPVGTSVTGVGNGPLPVGGVANAAAPTFVEGKVGGLSFDLSGNLRTTGGGAGGATAVTIANGADVALGTTTDAVAATPTDATAATIVSLMKALNNSNISAVPAGANIIGKVGIDQTTPGTTNAVQNIPGTTGGLSIFFLQPTASDNHAVIKAGAGQIYKISVTNNSATVNYIRFYNATTGFNGCNSASNLVYENAIPASTSVGGLADLWPTGMAFSTGISICVTSGYATNDTTNATATAMNVNVGYK